jgi:hypothetical protein
MGCLTNKAHSFTSERWRPTVAGHVHRVGSFLAASFISMICHLRNRLSKEARENSISWEFCMLVLLGVSSLQAGEQKITTKEAKTHLGETATVCGKVVGTRLSKYSVTSRGRPVSLSLDQPEPNPVFIVITWPPSDPAQPNKAEDSYLGKQVCATGKIVKARGVPEIVIPEPSLIQVQADEAK